eukprot:5865754-Amphidinium_carterae.1
MENPKIEQWPFKSEIPLFSVLFLSSHPPRRQGTYRVANTGHGTSPHENYEETRITVDLQWV